MNNETELSTSIGGCGTAVSGNVAKMDYSTPHLECFGSVAKLTQNGGGSASDGTGNSMTVRGSDSRIKENIAKIGTHPLGIGLYLFDYKSQYREQYGFGRQLGVMADEVESVLPAAVMVHADGHKMVDYAMLGIGRQVSNPRV